MVSFLSKVFFIQKMPKNPNHTQTSFPIFTHAEETDELLGKPPAWLLRSGISVIFLIIISFFTLSWFIKYPEVVITQATFTTYNPPISLVARSNGKIQQLFVKANDDVKANQVIAVIENTANYEHVKKISPPSEVSHHPEGGISDVISSIPPSGVRGLGELQPYYENYRKALKDYAIFKQLDYNQQKIKTLSQQIIFQQQLKENLGQQTSLQKEDLQLSKRQFEADSLLRQGGAVALKEMEQAKSSLIQRKSSLVQSKAAAINTDLRITELQQQIIDLALKQQETETQYQQQIEKSQAELATQIEAWKQRYLLISPTNGRVSFNQFWNINQEVKTGEEVFSVSPSPKEKGKENDTNIFCKTVIESRHAAKVQVGQAVIIKLAAYPFERFGILRATVAEISELPKEDKFAVTLKLQNGLVTNYQKTLIFKPQMQGTAEIITEDLRLLERLFYQYRSIIFVQ
jgi:multidrug resistance efflux pump